VVGDGDVLIATLNCSLGHLTDGVVAVGSGGVHVQIAAEVFHFAGHGYGGEGGGLILTGTAGGTAMLRAANIRNLDLSRCLLAVLSGCSTGSGELHGPGDPQSLVRAFLRAGTREVVASYWDLSSAGTSTFMQEFYQAMLSGAPVAESLRHATAVLRSGRIYVHPYYWAGLEVFQ